ncbi:unnamed protein product [Paramecium octaurelia]|uniref:Uncharacterized protein n=1 Tax=Paramecium octaurelia TaxID=43137 RepID=A0A8S1UV58_PAROT|nr:unnamed protein product [Paramecium octaurelia]
MQQKRSDSIRKNNLQVHYQQPLQLQYSSQPKQVPKQFQIDKIGKDAAPTIIPALIDMINQETDVYYLFDSFHSILNSLKQAEEDTKITQKNKQHTLDWWKVTGSSQSWTGVRNIQQLSESHMKQSSRFLDSYNSRGSAIIENLKRQIGELTEEQKFKQNSRMIGLVTIKLFDEQELYVEMSKQGRTLITVYQVQNKFHKCHMGFCIYSLFGDLQEKESIINKMYVAKWHRKNGNFLNIVTEFIQYIIKNEGVSKIKTKINSTQGQLIRHLQQLSFKLASTVPLINQIKVLTFVLISKEFKI